jgi:predicted short-subunit dehydrogenase-like oxidoreductase (DUF2520 family)
MDIVKVGFIGAGTVGSALAIRLSQEGYQVVAVSSLGNTSARQLAKVIGCLASENNQGVVDAADLVFITTPDDVIAAVTDELQWSNTQSVVHCSGADSTQSLEPARKVGAQVGVIHPLQTFASTKEAIENMAGSTFALEAEEPLLTILKRVANVLGGHWIELASKDKVIYHAAAVMACNYLVTLIKLATDLWQTFNIPPQEAIQAMLPLIRGTIHNIEKVGIPQCLTGPVARGDTGTINKHIEGLQNVAPSILPTYLELGLQTIPVALAKGRINQQQAQDLQEIMKQTA